MAAVQDVLGEHHDAVVATAWLSKTAHECSPTEAYAIGMLAQIEYGCASTARAEFRLLWRRVDTDRVRGWL
jgi:CHAD domain-containing protein